MASVLKHSDRIIQSLGFEPSSFHPTSFTFSLKPAPKSWKAFTVDDAHFPLYKIEAKGAKTVEIRDLITGIRAEHYVVIAELDGFDVLCMSRHRKGEQPLVLTLRQDKDYDAVITVFRGQNFTSDVLSAHYAINKSIDLLKSGSGEGPFINRGLFSNYFLKERLEKALSERKRDVWKEASAFFSKFASDGGGIPTDFEHIPKVLDALGYQAKPVGNPSPTQYVLSSGSEVIHGAIVVVSNTDNLDVMKSDDRTVPSVQAVSALAKYQWAILTNGRLWRLYSSKVSSASTNYFEVDIDGITDEKDQRLKYFVSLFSASALVPKQDVTDLDHILEGGVQYAAELEEDLRTKVFDKQLFLDLVRGVLRHSKKKKYSEEQLSDAKKKALKLLYRLLFILYAESRSLLPVKDKRYSQISLGQIKERLAGMEKDPESTSAWDALSRIFRAISEGDPTVNLPQYDGALFEFDETIDSLSVMNKHLVPALRALMERDGKGIDYQNLSVRQLGSLYEALLEYSVRQADTDLAIVKGEILDMKFAKEMKYERIIDEGELYLSAGGLARKGTGSYFTPEKIVKFLVKKGLDPIFADREKRFAEQYQKWRKSGDKEAGEKSTQALLDIQVVDPAMGSGHFLVSVVDEITKWIIGILDRYPDAPLEREIEEDRKRIIDEQKSKGIELDVDLLTFNVILKRMVMKRCVFGVDINPLAVELAKVSLWLDSFTIGTPLTFLDHHIRVGDSLIGLWMDNLKSRKPDNTTLDGWMGSVETISDIIQEISYPADLNINEIKKSRDNYEQFRKTSEPLRVLLDMQSAGVIDEELKKRLPPNLPLVEQTIRNGRLDKVVWSEPVYKSLEYAKKYHFFHWELEFPDAFTDERAGFDLIVTNPPWDAVRPYDDEFFSEYSPRFRRVTTKPEKEKIKNKLLNDPIIKKRYTEYMKSFQDRITFFQRSGEYGKRSTKGIAFDSWSLFLDRLMHLVTRDGMISVILPSGLVNNEGATHLRQKILAKEINHFYEFENKNAIFSAVHRSYKFVLLVFNNKESDSDFPAAFYLHNLDALEGKSEQAKFVKLSRNLIRLVSPASLSIPEVRNYKEIEICNKLYQNHPLLKKGINNSISFTVMRELNRTEAAKIFRTDGKGWKVFEGKNFHQFIPDYEKSLFTINREEGLEWTSTIKEFGKSNKEIHEVNRIAFRDIGGATYARGMIACIIPKHTFLTNTAPMVLPRINGEIVLDNRYSEIIAYLAGIFNSTVFDFLIRLRISIHISFFYLEQTPIPHLDGNLSKQICKLAARLNSTDSAYTDFAKGFGLKVEDLTMEERIETTAKLDALCAHLYGLTREEYQYVIGTFDVFDEDESIVKLAKYKWDESLIRKFNGEVRKRILHYFDEIATEVEQRNGTK